MNKESDSVFFQSHLRAQLTTRFLLTTSDHSKNSSRMSPPHRTDTASVQSDTSEPTVRSKAKPDPARSQLDNLRAISATLEGKDQFPWGTFDQVSLQDPEHVKSMKSYFESCSSYPPSSNSGKTVAPSIKSTTTTKASAVSNLAQDTSDEDAIEPKPQ